MQSDALILMLTFWLSALRGRGAHPPPTPPYSHAIGLSPLSHSEGTQAAYGPVDRNHQNQWTPDEPTGLDFSAHPEHYEK